MKNFRQVKDILNELPANRLQLFPECLFSPSNIKEKSLASYFVKCISTVLEGCGNLTGNTIPIYIFIKMSL